MRKIPSRYFAVFAGIICIVCICLLLLTDVATISAHGISRDYSVMDLIFSSDFDAPPYSKVNVLWRHIPLIIVALVSGSLICCAFYKNKWVVITGVVLSLLAIVIGLFFNNAQFNLDSADTHDWFIAYGRVLFIYILYIYSLFIVSAYSIYMKEKNPERSIEK